MHSKGVGFLAWVWVVAAIVIGVPGGCQDQRDITGLAHEAGRPVPPPPPGPEARVQAQVDSLRKAGIFVFWETLPSFPGGESVLKRYLSSHVRYPASAHGAGPHRTVVVQFLINRDGTLDHITAVGRPDSALAAEAVRVVRGMPPWIPGRQAGRIVKVRYMLPIRFSPE